MKIGIDFDDVTIKFVESLVEWHNKKYGSSNKIDDFKEFYWGDIWGTTFEEAVRRVAEFQETKNTLEIPPMENAIPSLKRLIRDNEITIVTGRSLKFIHLVEEWLDYHLKTKLKVIGAGEFKRGHPIGKAKICKELNIPILLEDAPETALDCAKEGIKVILFNQPWNKNIKHENIIRVNGWDEAIKEIKSISPAK